MRLVPFRSIPLVSDLPPVALADVLRGVVGDGPAAPFHGSVGADAFVIRRMADFRSTSMPHVSGRLSGHPGGGTAVRLRLRPAAVVFVFMTIWLAFLAATARMIVAAGRSALLLVAPAALAAVSWGVMASVFAADSRWGLEHLLERVPALRAAPEGRPANGT